MHENRKEKIMKKDKFMSKVRKLSRKAVCILAAVLVCANSLGSQGSFVYAAGTDTGSAQKINDGTNWWRNDSHSYSSYDDSKNKALKVNAAYGYKLKSKKDKNGNSLRKIEVMNGSTRNECSPPTQFHDKDVTLPAFLKEYTWFHVKSESDVFKVKITGLSIWQNGKFVDVDIVRTISNPKLDDEYGDGYVGIGAGVANASYVGLDQMTVKTQFYKAGTNTPITLKSNLTLNDIDECQYISINADKVTGEYVAGNTKLKYMEKGGNAYYCSDSPNYEGEAFTAVGFTFESNSFTYTFGRDMGQHPEYTHATRTEQYVGSGQSMVDFPTEAPVKTVTNDSNDKETDVKEIHVRDLSKTWTYSVSQPIPAKAENFCYDSFAFEDKVEECMKILDVKVVAANGGAETDVSSMFNISTVGNDVKATLKNPKDSEFYSNVLYTLKVKVRMNVPANTSEEQLNALRETWTTHGHYNETKTVLTENNSAKTIIDGENKVTNEVKTLIELSEMTPPGETPKPGLKITKDVNRYEHQVGDIVHYTVKVQNTNPNADTAYFTISDTTLPDTFAFDFSSVKVSGIDEANYTISQSGNGWVLKSKGDYALPYGTTITVTYDAKALVASNGTCVDNTASAIAAGIPEKTDKEQVYINSPKVDVVKTAPDKKYKVGDVVGYKVTITNKNAGTYMHNIVLNDVVNSDGLEIKEGTVAVLVGGKDITKDLDVTYNDDGKGFTINTEYNLKNGDIPCAEKDPYNAMTWADKVTVTYDAVITEDADVSSSLKNTFTAPATENVNGDLIVTDDTIPSGGGEDIEDITMKTPALEVTKTSDKQEYAVGATGTYTEVVKQTKENLTAKNVVVEDAFTNEDGVVIDADSLKVTLNKEDITKDCTITTSETGFKIETGKNLTDEDELVITYNATFTKTGEYANAVVASSDNTPDDEDNNVVTVKKADWTLTKGVDKDTYKVGDVLKYTIESAIETENAETTDVVLTDEVPDGLEVDEDSIKVTGVKDATVSVDGQTITINVPTMKYGETLKVTYDAKVLKEADGNLTNLAKITGEGMPKREAKVTVKPVSASTPSNGTSSSTPKTGDMMNVLPFAGMSVLALIGGTYAYRKRNKKEAK